MNANLTLLTEHRYALENLQKMRETDFFGLVDVAATCQQECAAPGCGPEDRELWSAFDISE